MGFKKHNWMIFSREGKIVEITIKEGDGRKLDFFRCNNPKEIPKITKLIKLKHGLDFTPEIKDEDSISFREDIEKEKEFLRS